MIDSRKEYENSKRSKVGVSKYRIHYNKRSRCSVIIEDSDKVDFLWLLSQCQI